jgi:peroxiredoxin/predicted 2-oxoglutarate/Fe(II)-dependent dioxygenase YbiX
MALKASEQMGVGDTIKGFTLPAHTGQPFKPGDVVGKPLVLFFYLQDDSPDCTAEACGFRDQFGEFQKLGASVVGVGVGSAESHADFAAKHSLPFPLLADEEAKVALAYGAARVESQSGPSDLQVSVGRVTYLIDAGFRVAKVYRRFDVVSHAAEVLEDLRKILLKEEPRRMLQHAPVLLIPGVFPPEFCRELIGVWETQGNEDSGFMKQIEGQTVGVMDYNHKIRRDHFLTNENPLTGRIKRYLAGRVIPDIIKAFNYEVTRFEDFRIACYDASRGGYFRAHRDNTTDGTAHRRFAMSLLLNDDYEGGSLRFPEYGPHTYRPEAGGAVIFSCSLLHEATDVTAGKRFVLLSFFYGEKEARIREEYNRRTGGGYRA